MMNPVWTYLSECLPNWMAPNLVTLTGLMLTTVCSAVILPIDLKTEIPPYGGYCACFALLGYQTLDTIDGK